MSPLNFKTTSTVDVWMSDEVWLNISCTAGEFTLTKDIWAFVFILADTKNQSGIKILDEHLDKSGKFQKMEVDFSLYKNSNA